MASARPYTEYAGPIEDGDAVLEDLPEIDAVEYIDTPQTETDLEVAGMTLSGRNGWPLADVCQNLRAKAVRVLLEDGVWLDSATCGLSLAETRDR